MTKTPTLRAVLALAVAAGLLAPLPTLGQAPAAGSGQAWPARQPIKLVAVFPPGGSVAQVSRLRAPVLTRQLGQTVIVENKGGASGSIGAAAVAAALGDGYTFAVVFDTHAASEFTNFAAVVAAAKTPQGASFGSIGSGSLGHLAMALLGKSGGLNFVHIPYKGGGPLMVDAVAGHVPLSIGAVFVTKPHIDSKRLRPLAVTTSKRAPELPDVPTVAESGFSGFDAPAWWAVLASAKTPPEIIRRMNEEINKALKNPDTPWDGPAATQSPPRLLTACSRCPPRGPWSPWDGPAATVPRLLQFNARV